MENNEFKKVRIKNRTCYYFDDLCIFDSIKYMDLFEFMMELDI